MLTQPLTPTIRLVNFGPGLTHSIRVPPRRVDFVPFLLPGYAAAPCTVIADLPWRGGSYTSPVTQSRCNNTANLRATATAALFFAFFPPRSQSRNPYRRKSVSGPNGPRRIQCLKELCHVRLRRPQLSFRQRFSLQTQNRVMAPLVA